MSDVPKLVELERRVVDMVLRYDDGSELTLEYVLLRSRCPCANCGPKREDSARIVEFEAEVGRLRNEKPKVEIVGGYGLSFKWNDSGCSLGIYGFELLSELASE
jgi:DUF971 family protein